MHRRREGAPDPAGLGALHELARSLGIVPPFRGRSSAAEHQLPKLRTRVRFPSPALVRSRPHLFTDTTSARSQPDSWRGCAEFACLAPGRAGEQSEEIRYPGVLGLRIFRHPGILGSMRRPNRTSDNDLRDLAIDALAKNVGPVTISTNSPFDLVVDVDGQSLAVELKTTAYGTVERFAAIKRLDPPRQAGVVLLIGRRINAPARAALEREGWGYLDAESGALYLQAPRIRIDTVIEPLRSTAIKKTCWNHWSSRQGRRLRVATPCLRQGSEQDTDIEFQR